eukprot:1156625-Pelagomonas_calceolata.AAC.1
MNRVPLTYYTATVFGLSPERHFCTIMINIGQCMVSPSSYYLCCNTEQKWTQVAHCPQDSTPTEGDSLHFFTCLICPLDILGSPIPDRTHATNKGKSN